MALPKLEPEFLTEENINPLVKAGKIKCDDQIGWRNVCSTQLSVARFAGAAIVNGVRYEYMYGTDELVREDIARMIRAERRKAKKHKPAQQTDLLEGEE